MNKKKTLINLGIVLGLSIFVLVWLLREDFSTTLSVIQSANPFWILIAVGVYILSLVITSEIMKNWLRIFNPNFKLFDSIKSNILATFARNVTPMQSGGQAMQVYVLNNMGVSVENSIFALSIDFVVYQVAQVLFSLILIIFYLPRYASNTVMTSGVLVGFILSSGLLVVLFLLVWSSKLHHFISKYGIKVLSKIKLVKNPEHTMAMMDQKIDDFASQLKYLKTQKRRVAINFMWVILGLVCTHSIPFIVAKALGIALTAANYVEFIALSVFISNFNALIPTPGGTGGLESVFMMMYGGFINPQSLMKGFMVLWRFVTYYFSVLVGSLFFVWFTGKKRPNT